MFTLNQITKTVNRFKGVIYMEVNDDVLYFAPSGKPFMGVIEAVDTESQQAWVNVWHGFAAGGWWHQWLNAADLYPVRLVKRDMLIEMFEEQAS